MSHFNFCASGRTVECFSIPERAFFVEIKRRKAFSRVDRSGRDERTGPALWIRDPLADHGRSDLP
jgi:hypothetical protein